MLRVPGFYHAKDPTSPQMVELLIDSCPTYTVDELMAAFPAIEAEVEDEGEPDEGAATKSRASKTKAKAKAGAAASVTIEGWSLSGLGGLTTGAMWAERLLEGSLLQGKQLSFVRSTVAGVLDGCAARQPTLVLLPGYQPTAV